MSFQNLSKGSILYIEALDPLAIDPATNTFNYKGATVTAPGNTYTAATATANGLSLSSANSLRFRRLTEHNRSPLSINTERIESSQRMANGTLRKYFIADKLNLSVSWEMVPSFRNETVDGAWGAEDLRTFYNSAEGQSAFNIRVNLAKDGTNQELANYESYTVVFSNCNFTVLKRGAQPFWNVSITMVQV